MNLTTTKQKQARQQIEGLRIETGGSVMLSPLAETILTDSQQPSDMKVFYVFGGAIATLLVGTAIGWAMNGHFAQAATEKAQIAAMAAEFNLKKNQTEIDNFCRLNSTLVKK